MTSKGQEETPAPKTEEGNSFPISRVPQIWEKFLNRIDQIEKLEAKLNEHVKRYRRRIACGLDQTPAHRKSHMRLFVTHKHLSESEVHGRNTWTLVVEGKLLIGLLDHASAQHVDKHGPFSREHKSSPEEGDESLKSYNILPSIPPETPVDEGGTSRADRNKYRSVGDVEEDPVEPTLFTHAFDKMVVTFRTVWQPETLPQSMASLTPPKKSRKRKAETLQAPAAINPKHLRMSSATKVSWTKKQSGDAHSFRINYTAMDPPESMKFHSVVASIDLQPNRPETLYRPSPTLAESIFPKHAALPSRKGKLRKVGENGAENEGTIPLENQIQVPSFLTMKEVIMGFHQYIIDKKLQDEGDKSLILCDKTLSDLLECDSLNFGDLQKTIRKKNLVSAVGLDEDPIELTYVMNETNGSIQEPLPPTPKGSTATPGHHGQLLSFDTDVYVPSFFHWRSREIMRRIKRREFEYTSSRTKARYMLVASRGNEDTIKTKIGECISGQGYAEENIPIFAALAKAAPIGSEAKGAAQIDSKTCALIGSLDQSSRQVQTAWSVVGAFEDLYGQQS